MDAKGTQPWLMLADAGGSQLRANALWLDPAAPTTLAPGAYEARLALPQAIAADAQAGEDSAAVIDVYLTLAEGLSAQLAQQVEAPEAPRLAGLALAFPGPMDYERGISLMHDLAKYEGLAGVALRPLLSEMLGLVPVHMANDGALFALGAAAVLLPGRPGRVAGLTLGTGCGSGFVVDGELLGGDEVRNGEEGVPPRGYVYDLALEREGGETTVEEALSARGLIATAAERGLDCPSAYAVHEAAERGDARAEAAFADYGRMLGQLLARWIRPFGPDLIALGGRMSVDWPRMAEGARERAGPELLGRVRCCGAATALTLRGAARYWLAREAMRRGDAR